MTLESEDPKNKAISLKNAKTVIIGIVIAIIVIGPSIYFYIKYEESQKLLQDVKSKQTTTQTSNTSTTSTTKEKVISPTSTSTTKPKAVNILILNGTDTKGLAASVKNLISDKIADIDTISVGNSVGDYEKTIIVDPKGNKSIDDQLAKLIGGTVTKALPKDEKDVTEDIIIILGADYE